ncbi:hypothetical protein VTJ49DRAFT_4034 [Mycothermus thermophilus]|uniref:NADP-dependent oxidoreductase domain-containing protein n=1 Tax=Humicola insolens TaxID=85995 RepID=A0ABR3V6B7_HUMIN
MTPTTTTTSTALPTLPSLRALRALSATSPERDAALLSALDILFEPSATLHSVALPVLNVGLFTPGDGAAAEEDGPDDKLEREMEWYERLVVILRSRLGEIAEEAARGEGDGEGRRVLHAILGSHPRLGRKPLPTQGSSNEGAEEEKLSALSAVEQGHLRGSGSGSGSGSGEAEEEEEERKKKEEEELARLNAEYEKRFPGLRYVTWVNGRPRSVILADMRERIAEGSLEEEERRGVELPTRRLGKNGPEVTALGLGLMGLSIAYGSVGSDEERLQFLTRAWELGCTHWDTADSYGDSEDLVGKWLARYPERRGDLFIATKFGLGFGLREDGTPGVTVDSSPGYCRRQCEQSLKRLGTDYVDLLYVHRVDGRTPVEETVREMVRLREEGKIRHIGLSACSAATLRRACAIAPIAAYQVEYSLWATDIEGPAGDNLVRECRAQGVAVVAYSPLGRGVLAGRVKPSSSSADAEADPAADLEPHDMRRLFPRFSADNLPRNLAIVSRFDAIAARKGCTPGQLALAWLLAQGEDVVPIPGTKKVKYLEENVAALAEVRLSEEESMEERCKPINTPERELSGKATLGFKTQFCLLVSPLLMLHTPPRDDVSAHRKPNFAESRK